jgi:hypothetical protein
MVTVTVFLSAAIEAAMFPAVLEGGITAGVVTAGAG